MNNFSKVILGILLLFICFFVFACRGEEKPQEEEKTPMLDISKVEFELMVGASERIDANIINSTVELEIVYESENPSIAVVENGRVKAIAAGVVYDGDFWDFYDGKASAAAALPIGVVQTIAAAGSEGSGDSVVTKEEGMLKRGASSEHIRPKFAVQNPALLCTLPAYQTACGITDIMAHVFERYFTNTLEVEITDRVPLLTPPTIRCVRTSCGRVR